MENQSLGMDGIIQWESNNNMDLKSHAPSRRSSSLDTLNGQQDTHWQEYDDDCKRKTCVVKLDGRQYTIGRYFKY